MIAPVRRFLMRVCIEPRLLPGVRWSTLKIVKSWPSCRITMPGRSCVALTLLIVVWGPDQVGADGSLESLPISEIPAGNKPFGKFGVGLHPCVARGMTRGTLEENSPPARNYSIKALIRAGQSPTFPKQSLEKEAQILRNRGEIHQVRENAEDIGGSEPEPLCQRGAVLIDRSRGDPPPIGGGVVRPAQREIGELAVQPCPQITGRATLHSSAHNHIVAAPGMIASGVGGGLKRAAEIRKRECCDVVLNAQLLSGLVKSTHRRAELEEQGVLNIDLVAVRIETAKRTEKNLAIHAKLALHRDDLCDLLELVSDGSRLEYCSERVNTLQRASEMLALCEGMHGDVARGLYQRDARIQCQNLLKSGQARHPLRR